MSLKLGHRVAELEHKMARMEEAVKGMQAGLAQWMRTVEQLTIRVEEAEKPKRRGRPPNTVRINGEEKGAN